MTTAQAPPQDDKAERAVLGAMMTSDVAPDRVIDGAGLLAEDFYLDRHRTIFAAMLELRAAGKPCDEISVAAALAEVGDLESAGGRDYLSGLAATVDAPGNSKEHAEIIKRLAVERGRRTIGAELAAGRLTAAQTTEQLGALTVREGDVGADRLERRGGSYLLDVPEQPEPAWEAGEEVLMAKGEPLVLAGPPGVGKTTLFQQLTKARCGVGEPRLLGLPVAVDDRPALYVAADRPAQARRSFARMVTEEDREKLNERLLIWKGPPPVNVTADPSSLARWVESLGVGSVFMDGLKDLAVGLAEDAVGAAVNLAVQEVVAGGIEFAACHHQRKSQDGRKPQKLDDVYGSIWLTAGAGSVVLLWGEPGDAHVELTHLKQPAAEVGPMDIRHDHRRGITTVPAPRDLVELARHGITVKDAAVELYSTDSPDRNQVERARRKLDRMAADGRLDRHDPGGKKPAVYTACDKSSVIARDSERDVSRGASRPVTQDADLASQSITPPITAHHAPNGRPSHPLKGGTDPDRDTEREPTAQEQNEAERLAAKYGEGQ